MSGRFIEGWRWCPTAQDIVRWEEGEDGGCTFCPADGHLTLVCARLADAAWEDNERLRRYLNVLKHAEMGEPEALAADMLDSYRRAAQGKNANEQVTRLVQGLARTAVVAMGNARWARLEQKTADELATALRTAVQRCYCLRLDVELCLECRAAMEMHKDWAWGPAHEELADLDQEPVAHSMEEVGLPPEPAVP